MSYSVAVAIGDTFTDIVFRGLGQAAVAAQCPVCNDLAALDARFVLERTALLSAGDQPETLPNFIDLPPLMQGRVAVSYQLVAIAAISLVLAASLDLGSVAGHPGFKNAGQRICICICICIVCGPGRQFHGSQCVSARIANPSQATV